MVLNMVSSWWYQQHAHEAEVLGTRPFPPSLEQAEAERHVALGWGVPSWIFLREGQNPWLHTGFQETSGHTSCPRHDTPPLYSQKEGEA